MEKTTKQSKGITANDLATASRKKLTNKEDDTNQLHWQYELRINESDKDPLPSTNWHKVSAIIEERENTLTKKEITQIQQNFIESRRLAPTKTDLRKHETTLDAEILKE